MKAWHLTKRFFGSLWPRRVSAEDAAFVDRTLLAPERELWWQMSRADRVHSLDVARDVVAELGDRASPPVVAAALLHDVGKIQSGLGTYLRVVATLSVAVVGRDAADMWVTRPGLLGRMGHYVHHPAIGADLLEMSGAAPLTVAWAREHHQPRETWSVPLEFADVLDAADND